MTVSGIASISESMRIKPVEERCPESFLAEIEIHVALKEAKGDGLPTKLGIHPCTLSCTTVVMCFQQRLPIPLKRSICQPPLDREASSHLKGICFMCSGWLYS